MEQLVKYSNGIVTLSPNALQRRAELQKYVDEAKALDDAFKKEALDVMELYDIKKIDNPYMTITYIEENTRTVVDTKALIKDGLYHKYSKETPVKASVRVKFKEKKDD
jgi:hypothetical protein